MKGLLRGTLVVTAGLVLLQALGWVREVILAYYFGTSSQLDALLVALTVPNFVAGTIGLAIGTAIVPVYHRWKTRDARPEGGSIAARLASIAGSVLVVTIPLALTALWGAPLLVRWIAPGFDSSTFVLAASMTRWLSVSAVPLTLSTYWAALVQADRRFEAQIAGTAVGTIVTLGGIWWLSPRLGVLGAALAFIGGALGQFTFFSVWQGYHHCLFPLSMQMGNQLARDVRELWLLMAPIIGGAALSQTRAVVDRLVASGLHTGAIASLNYAARIVNLPVILLGDGLMTVFFPNLSHQLASGNDRQSRRLLSFVPITLLTILMAPELVELLFQRGAFDAAATSRTASLVRVYALGLLPTVTGTASMRVFHASVDTLTPVIVGLISTVINIAGNFALARPLGAQGIALATSASMALRAWMMSRALRSRLPVLVHREPFDGAQESLFRLRLLRLALRGRVAVGHPPRRHLRGWSTVRGILVVVARPPVAGGQGDTRTRPPRPGSGSGTGSGTVRSSTGVRSAHSRCQERTRDAGRTSGPWAPGVAARPAPAPDVKHSEYLTPRIQVLWVTSTTSL